jgi:hypothetical protein
LAKLPQVLPSQAGSEQAPFTHVLPAGHLTPQAPQLSFDVFRLKQAEPHCVSPVGQTEAVRVTVTVVVVTGVGAVVVCAVIPQQEQALLYREAPSQALAYVGTMLGTTVICLAARRAASASRLAITGRVVVTVTVLVVVTVLRLRD